MNVMLLESILGGAGQLGFIQSALYPELQGLQQKAFYNLPNSIPGIQDLIRGVITGQLDYAMGEEYAQRLGFQPALFKVLYETSKQFLQPGDYAQLLFRGVINDDRFVSKMEQVGFRSEEANLLLQLSYHFPSVQDLVMFAVREVFTPATVAKYGQDQDFPPEFLEWSLKAGLKPDIAKMYWAAHWELPSITQGYEMFHRDVIDRNELEDLLRAQDVMPYWRERLLKISYNPLTRVDIRRAYALGVIDLAKVERAYLDDGYSPENATIITEFIRRDVHEELHGATKAQLISAYEDGIIDREGFVTLLESLNYGSDAITLIVSQVDYDILYKNLKSLEDLLTQQIKMGQITVESAIDELRNQDAPSGWMIAASNRLKKASILNHKLPTVTELQRFVKKGILDEGGFIQRMVSVGYSPEDSLLYLQDARS